MKKSLIILFIWITAFLAWVTNMHILGNYYEWKIKDSWAGDMCLTFAVVMIFGIIIIAGVIHEKCVKYFDRRS